MKNDKQSLVFFGSGPVAAKSLELLSKNFYIEAVVTKPTTKKEMSVVSRDAEVHCVSDKHELDELFTTIIFKSNVAILIDFGIIVSKKVIDHFPKGIINSHFSLLPELRGADPISFAILEDKKKTGVSLMLLVQAMDEGPLLHQSISEIDPEETTPSLTEKLVKQSYHDLVAVVPKYLSNKLTAQDQIKSTIASKMPTYTRKLTKSDGIIDWTKPANQIDREIRAYLDWPKSRCRIGDIDCILTKAYSVHVNNPNSNPGKIEIIEETKSLKIDCGVGSLYIQRLKPAGKNDMPVESFLAGYRSRIH